MKKLIYYTELAILVLALYFTHLKLLHFQYIEGACAISAILIYRGISIYKTKSANKVDGYYKNIIADLEKRLSDEMMVQKQLIEPIESVIDQPEINIESILNQRDQSIINKLKSGQSGVSISKEMGVDPATISRLKKEYCD